MSDNRNAYAAERADLPSSGLRLVPSTPVRLEPTRHIDLLVHFSGAFDLAEGRPLGHACRVAYLALATARRLKVANGLTRRRILYGALLHSTRSVLREQAGRLDATVPVGARLCPPLAMPDTGGATHRLRDRAGAHGALPAGPAPVETLVVDVSGGSSWTKAPAA